MHVLRWYHHDHATSWMVTIHGLAVVEALIFKVASCLSCSWFSHETTHPGHSPVGQFAGTPTSQQHVDKGKKLNKLTKYDVTLNYKQPHLL